MPAQNKAAPARRPPTVAKAKSAACPPPPEDDQQSSDSYSSEEEVAAEEPGANEAAQPAPPPPQAEGRELPPPPPPPAAVLSKYDKPDARAAVHLVPAAAGGADAAAGALGGGAVIAAWARQGDWRSFSPESIYRGWTHVFDEWGIDDAAQQSLFCLAQHSQQGYQEANDVIGKTIIRLAVQGPGSIANISGWLTRCCNDARRVMHYQDYWHSMNWGHWRSDVQYHQYCQQQRASSNIGDHRRFQGYDRGAKGGGKGHRGGRRADREQQRGGGDVGQVTGGDHRTDDGTPDRRQRDHHGSEESDCGDHGDRRG